MNKMTHFKYIIAALLLLTTISCSKSFLDEQVLDQYTPSSLVTLDGAETGLIGLYQMEQTLWANDYPQGTVSAWNVGTDVAIPAQPEGVEVPYYNYSILTASDYHANRIWSLYFNIIENANNVIAICNQLTEEGTESEEDVDPKLGEARFWRAYAYNNLATFFGDVPIIEAPINEVKVDFTRDPLSEVNDFINADLLFAEQYIPTIDNAASSVRANTNTVCHLASKFYLRTGEYAKAEEYADKVIDGGDYQLVSERYGIHKDEPGDPFSDMFFKGNMRRSEGNTEIIWALQEENPSDVANGSIGNPQQRRVWGAAYHNITGLIPCDSLGGRGLARLRLSNWVIQDLYEEGDMRNSQYNIRREYWFNDPTSPLYGEKVIIPKNDSEVTALTAQFKAKYGLDESWVYPVSAFDSIYSLPPYSTKWKHFDSRDEFGYGMWKDIPMMRLGETYLFKAEAQCLQGNSSGAAATINILRERADAPLVSASDIDLDFILDERVRELIGEENRRETLMRTGMLVERTERLNSPSLYPSGQYPTEANQLNGLDEHNLLLPIPLTEILLNRDEDFPQNPGY